MERLINLLIAVLVVSCFLLLADWRHRNPGPSAWLEYDLNEHLGAEYDDIARAIRSGRGFSDPFREETGPTAWMPPVLPYFQAFLYWLSGDNRATVVELILSIEGIVIVFTGYLIVAEARLLGLWWLGCGIFIVALAVNFYDLFLITHDVWLNLAVANLIWLGLRKWPLTQGSSVLQSTIWGVLGGLSALCNPTLGAVWAVLTLHRMGSEIRTAAADRAMPWKRTLVPFVMATLVSMVVVSPWVVRNRLVLGKWIPVKSNATYEVWQSLCADDDGLVDGKLLAVHPWSSGGALRVRYRELGEVAFLDEKWPEVRAAFFHNPGDAMLRLLRRASAALLYYRPLRSSDEESRPWPVFLKRVVHPLPFLAWLVLVVPGRKQRSPAATIAVWMFAVWIVPYILVSYYDRYAAPMITLKVMLILHAISLLLPHRSRKMPDLPSMESRPEIVKSESSTALSVAPFRLPAC